MIRMAEKHRIRKLWFSRKSKGEKKVGKQNGDISERNINYPFQEMQIRKKCWSLYLQEDNSWRRSGKSKATLKRCFANCTKTQPILIVFRWMESFQWEISKNVHRNKRWNEFKEFLRKIFIEQKFQKNIGTYHTHTYITSA